jgi:hypothetical protein
MVIAEGRPIMRNHFSTFAATAPLAAGRSPLGSTDVEDMIAKQTGETRVTVQAIGAPGQIVRFRVVP